MIFAVLLQKKQELRRWDTRTWRDISLSLYLFTTELRHSCTSV